MIASALTYKDVNKYFQQTFVIVPEVDPHQVQLLVKATPEGVWLRNPVTDEEGVIDFSDGFQYSLQSPLTNRRRWFTYKNNAVLIERIPQRMWHKGICPENTLMCTITKGGDISQTNLSPDKINAMLQFKPMEEFKRPITGGAVALSDTFALGGTPNNLFLWDTIVGRFAPRTKEMFICRELEGAPLPEVFNSFKVAYV